MNSEIIGAMNELSEKFGVAIDWSQKNIQPYLTDLVHRVAMYEVWSSAVWIAFVFVGMCLSVLGVKKLYKLCADDYDLEEVSLALIALIIVLGAIGTTIVLSQILDIVKALNLPELVVLEQLQNF